jgi:S-adenosylmethionine:tRNA ribosyltransferase-isomerase
MERVVKFWRGQTRSDRPRDENAFISGAGLRTDEVSRFAVRLVVIDSDTPRVVPFASIASLLRANDLVVVNDAATLPASLPGTTSHGAHFELRLSGPVEPHRIAGVLLGEGDYHTRTEHRPAPPTMAVGDRVRIGSFVDGDGFSAIVTASAGRMVELATTLPDDELWRAIYAAGAPVQYAHRAERLDLWSVQTAYASRPWAVEMPSAGRPLTWRVLLDLRRAGVEIATLTHAAGLSSTGDEALDRALPWPERFEIPRKTVDAIAACKAHGGRVIAVGTTVVRALESAARQGDGVLRPGGGVATDKLGPQSKPQVVDGLVSGLHSPGESHFELLRAFAPRERLERALSLAVAHGLSSHELGDACVILRS